MHIETLVQMANRIGQFFQAQPDPQEARRGIADHIAKFWEPRMRQQLAAHLAEGGHGLLPIVVQALAEPAGTARPAH